MSDVIADGKVVAFHYTLTDDDGTVIDTSSGKDPMLYLHGSNNIVPGLEKRLVGQSAGDSLQVDVPPSEGYGERQGPGAQAVPRSQMPEGVELQVGMPLQASGSDGQTVVLWVTELTDDTVFVDLNHPLAGKTLHFDVQIVAVRGSTAVEKQHGHPHGMDGSASH